jgi:hypothetical protein
VAPSERPIFAAHRSNTREWYRPQARIAGHLTLHLRVWFRVHCGPSANPIAKQCDPFATYRRVSLSPGSTICTCIARTRRKPKSGGPTQLSPQDDRSWSQDIRGVWIILSHARANREKVNKRHSLAICIRHLFLN